MMDISTTRRDWLALAGSALLAPLALADGKLLLRDQKKLIVVQVGNQ